MLPIVLLIVGVAVAASFGARLGPGQLAYRLDLADAQATVAPLPPGPRVVDWAGVGLAGWLGGVGLVVVGAVMARRRLAIENAGSGDADQARVDFRGAVERVRAEIDRLAEAVRDLPLDQDAPQVRAALDALVDGELEPIVAGRGQLVARHGLAVFATYFGPYATGERKLARCWSALTDGHAEVAREALDDARAAFDESLAAWDRAEGR